MTKENINICDEAIIKLGLDKKIQQYYFNSREGNNQMGAVKYEDSVDQEIRILNGIY